jgi:hypothetical protein
MKQNVLTESRAMVVISSSENLNARFTHLTTFSLAQIVLGVFIGNPFCSLATHEIFTSRK